MQISECVTLEGGHCSFWWCLGGFISLPKHMSRCMLQFKSFSAVQWIF